MLKKNRLTVLLILLVTLSLILSSCGSARDAGAKYDRATEDAMEYKTYATSSKGYAPGAVVETELADGDFQNASRENGSGLSTTSVLKEKSDRKIIYNAWADIETKEYDKSIIALNALCEKYGAYFESSNSYGGHIGSNSERRSSFTIRIPVDGYSDFVSEVGNIGTVTNSGENNRDVTEEYFDTEARLESAKIREERVLVLLENAGSLDDILALERELSDIRYEIESYSGNLRKYDSLISYATYTLNINEVIEYTKPTIVPLTFGEELARGFSEGFEDFVDGWQDFAVFLSRNVFNLVTLLIIGGVASIFVILALKRPKSLKKKSSVEKNDENK
ncbi:MAG: DUF4349 domain-containing protein [Clostridia bacterium]|nr:DUF4349 domain-containing protein [Clostridia bacterium]